jgi:hypothetical protein
MRFLPKQSPKGTRSVLRRNIGAAHGQRILLFRTDTKSKHFSLFKVSSFIPQGIFWLRSLLGPGKNVENKQQ